MDNRLPNRNVESAEELEKRSNAADDRPTNCRYEEYLQFLTIVNAATAENEAQTGTPSCLRIYFADLGPVTANFFFCLVGLRFHGDSNFFFKFPCFNKLLKLFLNLV